MILYVNNTPYVPVDYRDLGYNMDILLLEMGDGSQWIVAADYNEAGLAAEMYWETQAKEYPQEFLQVFDPGAITTWLLGDTETFQDWLEYVAENPTEHWARATGQEDYVDEVDAELVELLGFTPTVAYRWS